MSDVQVTYPTLMQTRVSPLRQPRVVTPVVPDPYTAWLMVVDQICYERAYISVHDLTGCAFGDWFAAGWTPTTAAEQALASEGWNENDVKVDDWDLEF